MPPTPELMRGKLKIDSARQWAVALNRLLVIGAIKMRLSLLLEKKRTDRPDEWSMDELARKARQLEDALLDARSGMNYIRQAHGNLYGVGFDRVEEKAAKALDD